MTASHDLTGLEAMLYRAITARTLQVYGKGVSLLSLRARLKKKISVLRAAALRLEGFGLIRPCAPARGAKVKTGDVLYVSVAATYPFRMMDGVHICPPRYTDGYEPNNRPPEIVALHKGSIPDGTARGLTRHAF